MATEVMVGDKEIGRYHRVVNQQLEEHDTVHLMSRGKENNGKALDIAEIIRREEGAEVADISTDTAEFENEDGETVRVTDLEVEIEKIENEE